MSRRISLILNILFVLAMGAGLVWQLLPKRERQQEAPEAPIQMVLFSLDGWSPVYVNDVYSGPIFYGYPVLGKIEITDPAQQKQLLASLHEAMQTPGLTQPKCFDPRHGLRVTSGGHTTDYLICFECVTVDLYQDDVPQKGSTISPEPRKLFNRIFRDNAIPLGRGSPQAD